MRGRFRREGLGKAEEGPFECLWGVVNNCHSQFKITLEFIDNYISLNSLRAIIKIKRLGAAITGNTGPQSSPLVLCFSVFSLGSVGGRTELASLAGISGI